MNHSSHVRTRTVLFVLSFCFWGIQLFARSPKWILTDSCTTDSTEQQSKITFAPEHAALIVDVSITPASCNLCNGKFTPSISGGTPPYEVDWGHIPGTSNPVNLTNLCDGTYSLTVRDASGQSAFQFVTILQLGGPTLSLDVENQGCNSTLGNISAFTINGLPPYSYAPYSIANLPAGTYCITVTDATGCKDTTCAEILYEPSATAHTEVTHTTTFGGSDGYVDLILCGGTPPFLYNWADIPGANDPEDRANMQAGNYLVNITDANGCGTTHSVQVLQPGVNLSGVQVDPTVIQSCGSSGSGCSGRIILDVTGATPPYNYNWDHIFGNNDPQSLTNLCSGVYTVTITDATLKTAVFRYRIRDATGTQGLLTIESGYPAFCNNIDSSANNNCEIVCPNSTVTYRAVGDVSICGGIPSYFIWKVTGAESFSVSPSTQEVTVNWPATGSGSVEVSGTTAVRCFSAVPHCVNISLLPKAAFSSIPAKDSVTNVLKICKGQTVWLQNQSLLHEKIEWFFSDNLSKSSEDDVAHIYKKVGLHQIRLIAKSSCFCADTTILTVEVLDSEAPSLDCIGAVCTGEEVTYTASGGICNDFEWNVTPNGTVTNGGNPGDPSVTVLWTEGTEEGGIITLNTINCATTACLEPAVIRIPVTSDAAEIEGRARVCSGTQETYKITKFDGVVYTWTVSSGGTILSGQGRNKIEVQWNNTFSDQRVMVEYGNCYLDCSGRDTLEVFLRPKFTIKGPIDICAGSNGAFNATQIPQGSGVNCEWYIKNDLGDLITTFSFGFSIVTSFPTDQSGLFNLYAFPIGAGLNATCSDSAVWTVNVAPKPPKPGPIVGPTTYCPGLPLTYSTVNSDNNNIEWRAKDAIDIFPPYQGNSYVISFGSGTAELTARQVSPDGLGCISDTARLIINKLTTIPLSGNQVACKGISGTYTTLKIESASYQWAILPESAGVIESGVGTNIIKINWIKEGNHKVQISVCNLTRTYDVTVNPDPQPIVVHPPGLCPNTVDTLRTTQLFPIYKWKNEVGMPLINTPTLVTGPGNYGLEVVSNLGCKGFTSFSIEEYPAPIPNISTFDPLGFCNNSRTVKILTPDNEAGTMSFQWFRDNIPVGTDAPFLFTNQYGNYSVAVTNQFNCTTKDGTVIIYEYCDPIDTFQYEPADTIKLCPPGALGYQILPSIFCDSVTVQLIAGPAYQVGSAEWTFTEAGTNQFLKFIKSENTGYRFDKPGKYWIGLTGYLQDGTFCSVRDTFQVNAAANFFYTTGCPGGLTGFKDESTVLPGNSISTWRWDFGDNSISADTSSLINVDWGYTNSGLFKPTLTITADNGCISTRQINVRIPDLPIIQFYPTPVSCTGNSTLLGIFSQPDFSNVTWDFGDPASGEKNTGAGAIVYHKYDALGTFTATVTVSNIFGCSLSDSITVEINPGTLSGQISPANPKVCEGNTVTLSAPPVLGNVNYVWSNGYNTPTIVVDKEGVYALTMTDANGCLFSPLPKIVRILPVPDGQIKALLYNENGQIIGSQAIGLEVCEGEDVFLKVNDNGTYKYTWSEPGASFDNLIFQEDRGTALEVGNYTYTVTVTNLQTGCTLVTSPFQVNVNPTPEGFSIDGTLFCSGTPSELNYIGPEPPEWKIIWSTGETSTMITTEEAGKYFVRVVNQFGCVGESNTEEIRFGPNAGAIPAGCHTRCTPDSICIEFLPDVTNWQWFLNGAPIPGATSPDFVAYESGEYWAELSDSTGCTVRSEPLTLDLFIGTGDVTGQVWSDVNNNGVIDAADTLIQQIPVQLFQNNIISANAVSDSLGQVAFKEILAVTYVLAIDTLLLPNQWDVVIGRDSAVLTGCDNVVRTGLLLYDDGCNPGIGRLDTTICAYDNFYFNGTLVLPNVAQNFVLQSPTTGCDSIVTVEVKTKPLVSSSRTERICPGETYIFQNTTMSPGQSLDFAFYTPATGCDSIVTIKVEAYPLASSSRTERICPDETFLYEGIALTPGQTQQFTLQNPATGCDSTVTLQIVALPIATSTRTERICPDETFLYEGTALTPGQTQQFTLQNPATGCDSTVTLQVVALPIATSTRTERICPDETFLYEGTALTPGQTQQFTLQNPATGCDSTVTLQVVALPIATSTRTERICPDETFLYEGIALTPGQTQQFTLQNPATGCDSTVTLQVVALPIATSTRTERICPDATFLYEGIALTPGQTQQFTLQNPKTGCDSIVTLQVLAHNIPTSSLTLKACEGTSALYNNTQIPAGTQQSFVLLNPATQCDSIVNVSVTALIPVTTILDETICPGTTYAYLGNELAAGTTYVFEYLDQYGCDSTVRITIAAWPAIEYSLETDRSCPNQATGSIAVEATGGTPPLRYALSNAPWQAGAEFTDVEAGLYTIQISDASDCVYEDSVQIESHPAIEIELPELALLPCDPSLPNEAVQVVLQPVIRGYSEGLAFEWSNGAKTLVLNATQPDIYTFRVSNVCERVERSVSVEWAGETEGHSLITLPNVVDPSSDDPLNRRLQASFAPGIVIRGFNMQVFDRWGSLVFQTDTPNAFWDTDVLRRSGNSTPVNAAVFIWIIDVEVEICGRVRTLRKSGDVTVLD